MQGRIGQARPGRGVPPAACASSLRPASGCRRPTLLPCSPVDPEPRTPVRTSSRTPPPPTHHCVNSLNRAPFKAPSAPCRTRSARSCSTLSRWKRGHSPRKRGAPGRVPHPPTHPPTCPPTCPGLGPSAPTRLRRPGPRPASVPVGRAAALQPHGGRPAQASPDRMARQRWPPTRTLATTPPLPWSTLLGECCSWAWEPCRACLPCRCRS